MRAHVSVIMLCSRTSASELSGNAFRLLLNQPQVLLEPKARHRALSSTKRGRALDRVDRVVADITVGICPEAHLAGQAVDDA